MIDYRVNVERPVKQFEAIAERSQEPEKMLKRWGGYLKSAALKRADAAQGWAPLAESTRYRLEHTRTANVTAMGSVRASYARGLEKYLAREEKRGSGSAAQDLAELRRLRAGGSVGKIQRGQKWSGSKAIDRLRRAVSKAQAQRAEGKRANVGGDKRRSAGHKMLGRVARQLVWAQSGASVSVMSKVPFSAVHNDGGSAGKGASIPKRQFLTIDEKDRIVLAQIAEEHLTEGTDP